MSTLRLSVVLLILLFFLGLIGCSSTSAYRTTPSAPKMRTVASIGDRPLPVLSGEPGDVVAGQPEPGADRISRGDVDENGRIAGRVVDERGQPVAGARVRLAVSSAQGGKMVRATTDRSGGFTLRGLRPGTPYTVIAEWEDDQGILTGRSNVQAPDADVRIALDASAGESTAAQAPARVSAASRRRAADDDDVVDVVSTPINVDDLPPPPAADELAPAPRTRGATHGEPAAEEPVATSRGNSSSSSGSSGWRPIEHAQPAGSPGAAGADAGTGADPDAPSQPLPLRRRRNPSAEEEPATVPVPRANPNRGAELPIEPATPGDDGPNPLPPALEPGEPQASLPALQAAPAPVASRGAEDSKRAAALDAPVLVAGAVAAGSGNEPAPLPDLTPGAMVTAAPLPVPASASASAADPAPMPEPMPAPASASAPAVATAEPLPPPAEMPPAVEPAPAAEALPGPVATADPLVLPPAAAAAGAALGAGARPVNPPVSSAGTERPLPGESDPEPLTTPPPARPRVRWRDLAAGQPNPPPLETAARGSPPEPEIYCRFDSRHRRIEDFRLPDIQGRPVRFQDFDADLILLDFWGSWCQPCLRSVPHLVDIQKRLDGKQLQVVGIACEREETPPAQRVAGVAKTAQKLGINYPVLVTSMDGTCPLQKALHIQAYPTLILVDRQGRILWQDQGATRLTMARLDRMISLATKPDTRRRY